VAAQATPAHRVLFQEVVRRTLAGEGNEEIARALDPLARQTFDLLQRGLNEKAGRAREA
jgi:hypothetical protein